MAEADPSKQLPDATKANSEVEVNATKASSIVEVQTPCSISKMAEADPPKQLPDATKANSEVEVQTPCSIQVSAALEPPEADPPKQLPDATKANSEVEVQTPCSIQVSAALEPPEADPPKQLPDKTKANSEVEVQTPCSIQVSAALEPPEADPPKPKPLADVIKACSSEVKSQTWPLPVYQVPLEDEQLKVPGCRRFRFGEDSTKPNRTIMVMGATGAGKSTLIDGMINYILGVRWEDDYRFKLVREVQKGSQAVSQTSEATVYKLNYQDGFQVKHSLTIIDTPGFGDTRGFDRDREITEQLRKLFTSSSGVVDIDAVCFVVQASLARLTPSQRYVFDSVLAIFGKDIAENIRVLVTFADGQRPPVLDAIIESKVPCPIEKGVPVHFKFNNSALFANNNASAKEQDEEEDEEEEGFDSMFWNMGTKSMKRFFTALNKIQTKSLTMTKEVLTERKQLENLVENLQKQVKVGLLKLEEIRQTSQMVATHSAEITRNANFEFNVTVTEPKQIDISGKGIYITNCQQCHYTCHDNCIYPNDEDKINCCAMSNGVCTVCPNKCIWNVHFNQKYKWEYVQVTRKETIEDLKEKYDIAKNEKNTAEALLNKMHKEYENVQVAVTVLIDQSIKSLNRLKEIALKPDPLSAPEYIDMLIKGEKSEAKLGWQKRVDSLMAMKEKAEYMDRVNKGEILLENVRPMTQSNQTGGFFQRITKLFWS